MGTNRTSLGVFLSGVRNARKISRKYLAERLGISYAYLANLEHGQRPLPDTLWEPLEAELSLATGTLSELSRLANIPDSPAGPDTGFKRRLGVAFDHVLAGMEDEVDKVGLVRARALALFDGAGLSPASQARRDVLMRLAESLPSDDIELLIGVARLMKKREISENKNEVTTGDPG